jgi:hypothetical protein
VGVTKSPSISINTKFTMRGVVLWIFYIYKKNKYIKNYTIIFLHIHPYSIYNYVIIEVSDLEAQDLR